MTDTRFIWTLLMVTLAVMVSSLVVLTPARAHEVQPAVLDVEFLPGGARIDLAWTIEAPLAGMDLDGVENTNQADGSEEYDRLRALEGDDLALVLEQSWQDIAPLFDFSFADHPAVPRLISVTVPDAPNLELPRISELVLQLPYPVDATDLVIGWDAQFGPLVVRQKGVENGYTGFLTSGALSDPIPMRGAAGETAVAALLSYVFVGFDHIVPLGLDHILFVLGLFFLSTQLRPLLWQITAFTLAHTVTLALGALEIIRIPPQIVEPLIAASIVYVAVENLMFRRLTPWRPLVVFGFGLLHGLGFASVLSDFGLGASNFIPKLIGFNIGVEIGQLAVIAAAWLAFGVLFARADWYFRRISAPVSAAIAMIALLWVIERLGFFIHANSLWPLFQGVVEGTANPAWMFGSAVVLAIICVAPSVFYSSAQRHADLSGSAVTIVCFCAFLALFTAGAFILAAVTVALWVFALWVLSAPLNPADPIPSQL